MAESSDNTPSHAGASFAASDVDTLLGALTLAEKVDMMSGHGFFDALANGPVAASDPAASQSTQP